MMKKATVMIFSFLLLMNMYGCVAILAGAAGGAGTAAWLSGKLSEEFNASFTRSLEATKRALNSLKFKITKETVKEEVAQVMGEYADGRTIWVDIRRISDLRTQIEVRVGVKGEKEAAQKILDKIKRYL